MDQLLLERSLADLPIGDIRFYKTIGSTNDEAINWSQDGAPDLSIVVADEQTHGKGRLGRKWVTPSGSALALSLILYPTKKEKSHLPRITGLAALALTESMINLGLSPQIKWPNDILLNGEKVAGILVEANWVDSKVGQVVIGMGVNVSAGAVPDNSTIRFPATSIETHLGHSPQRIKLVHSIINSIISLRPHIASSSFISKWDEKLAYKNTQIQIENGGPVPIRGQIIGLESNGNLRLSKEDGSIVTIHFGEVSLRIAA